MTIKEKNEYLSEFATPERIANFKSVLSQRTRYVSVILEDIYQGHNASAVLRTCECLGIQDIYTIENIHPFTPNHDIDMGSSKWLSLQALKEVKPAQAIQIIKSKGYRVVATIPGESCKPLTHFDLTKGKTAFLFGTELNGISTEAMNVCDEFVSIPMYGFTESYNISVSVAIIFSYLTERLRESTIPWQLSEEEQDQLFFEWITKSVKFSQQILRRIEE